MTAPRLGPGGMIGGKYTVRSILGNGGSVITYHASGQAGQDVVVKLYDPAVASHTSVMKSLEQAYAATNALPANSAAPIIDAGYDQPTLAPFSVTELLRLPSLSGQQRRLQPEEVVALLKGLARSLDLAHVRNVVHGAIKPTNVFVGPSSNPVIVTDFGANLAKAAVPTQEGFVLSAPWIAPEQAQSGSVAPSADVFSVGLLCFYALTGRSYWRSCQSQNFELGAWQAELGAGRTPASARAAELGVPLSPQLDLVLWKALSVEPTERYKSIGEFSSAMEDTMRSSAGSAATMALPMIGDAPSPLPSNMQNPERQPQRPNINPAATLALPAEAFMPGYDAMQAGMGQAGMGQAGMGQAGMQQAQQPGMGQPGQHDQGYNQAGYAGASMSQQGMPAVDPMMQGQMGGPAQAYAYGADQGYPPPPGALMTQYGPGPQPKGNKIVPIVIGITAVALLGAGLTVLALKWSDLTKPEDTSPVVVASAPTASAAATADAPPTATATEEPTAAASASAAPVAEVVVKLSCVPSCDEVKIDDKVIEAKDLPTLKLAPGKYKVDLSKKDYLVQSEEIEVKEGATFAKTFVLKRDPSAAPIAAPVNTTPRPVNTGKKPCKKTGFITKC